MIDLAFAISSNAPGSEQNFKKIKDAIDFIIRQFGADRIRYAVIRFGSSSFGDITFQDVESVDELRVQIDQLPRASGVPNLKEMLKKVKTVFDQATERPGAKRFLVVLMDTKSSSSPKEVTKEADSIEKDGIKASYFQGYFQ